MKTIARARSMLTAAILTLAPCLPSAGARPQPDQPPSQPQSDPGAAGLAHPAPHSPAIRPLPLDPKAAKGAASRFDVNIDDLRTELSAAPALRADQASLEYAPLITLPAPDAVPTPCRVVEAPVMHPDLQARFPQIRTYIVQSEDRTAVGRLALSPHGLSGMLRTPVGVWMIDADDPRDPARGIAYWLHNRAAAAGAMEWACHTIDGVHGAAALIDRDNPADAAHLRDDRGQGAPRRTYRLAVACTGEWGAHQATLRGRSPNTADALAGIVAAVARANVVFEGDLAVSFQLVADNDRLVAIDPAADAFPDTCDGTGGADCSSPYIQPTINFINTTIGEPGYDVGHLLSRVYGGLAYTSSSCTTFKAGAVSGIPRGGDNDDLAFLVFVHELGHQFGASHTFSGTRGRCGNFATLASAWEAGSGSSPMAYAGACPVGGADPSDNVAVFADPFFHHASIEQMRTFLARPASNCAATTQTANLSPSVTVPQSVAIPPGTPFELVAAAADPNNDPLTFSWEQLDNGVRRPLTGEGSDDNGMGALFRIFPPTQQPSRTFPRMTDVLAAVFTPGERLPTLPGFTRRFRCIVRDSNPVAGAPTISATVNLTIALGATPFALLTPTPGSELEPGDATLTWTVAGTDAPPISCSTLRVRLSADDGHTFPLTLATLPNTGVATIQLPPAIARARLRLDAVDNVFFAVSPPFSVRALAGDFNLDAVVSQDDIFDFLAAWFAQDPRTDLDSSGSVTVEDLFTFLQRWFQTRS